MNNQEQQEERQVKLDNWPVSFSEWVDAYIVQILEQETKNYGKDYREGLLDKLMFRVRLVLDAFVIYAKQGKESVDWILSKKATFFLENDDNKEQYLQWKDSKENELLKAYEEYYEYKEKFERYEERIGKKLDRLFWVNINKYVDLMVRYGGKVEELEKREEKWEKKQKRFLELDEVDFLNTFLLKTVSKLESDFYCFLLREPFLDRNIIANLKEDKWWVVDIETRVQLLQSIELLMSEEKWDFIESDFYLIALKLLRPHEYILTKESIVLLRRVCDLYSVGNSRTLKFCEEKNSENDQDMDCLEIEYSDVLDSEMSESDDEEKAGMTKGEKILELAKGMKVLSQELSVFIEKNETYPDLKKKMEEIEKIYFKGKEHHKC